MIGQISARTSSEPAPNRFGASSEPASVMEFGFCWSGLFCFFRQHSARWLARKNISVFVYFCVEQVDHLHSVITPRRPNQLVFRLLVQLLLLYQRDLLCKNRVLLLLEYHCSITVVCQSCTQCSRWLKSTIRLRYEIIRQNTTRHDVSCCDLCSNIVAASSRRHKRIAVVSYWVAAALRRARRRNERSWEKQVC